MILTPGETPHCSWRQYPVLAEPTLNLRKGPARAAPQDLRGEDGKVSIQLTPQRHVLNRGGPSRARQASVYRYENIHLSLSDISDLRLIKC